MAIKSRNSAKKKAAYSPIDSDDLQQIVVEVMPAEAEQGQEFDIESYLDLIEDNLVSGWAWRSASPEERLLVELLIDNVKAGELIADQYRKDVHAVGKGDGRYGYCFKLPSASITDADRVQLRIAGKTIVERSQNTVVNIRQGALKTERVSSQESVTWYDVTDFVFYIWHHAKVSGIQRVQAGLLANILRRPNITATARFCAMDGAATLDYREISAFNLKLIIDSLGRAAEVSIEDWRKHISELSVSERSPRANFRPIDTLVILGASWIYNHQPQRILQTKRQTGISIVKVIYDLIPLMRPELVNKELGIVFAKAIFAALAYADGFLTISRYTTSELLRFIKQRGIATSLPVTEFSMGTELSYSDDVIEHSSEDECSSEVESLVGESYVLFVSTVEIRKNHLYLLRIWQRLLERYSPEKVPKLVFVGRRGWLVEDLFAQLDISSNLDGKIVHLEHVSDYELHRLYENCQFTVYPSIYEGWGLPVSESLNYGKVCVASNATSIPEAGKELALYIDPLDLNSGYRAIESLIFDSREKQEREAQIRREYRTVKWSEATESFTKGLRVVMDEVVTNRSTKVVPATTNNLFPLPTATLGTTYKFGTDHVRSGHIGYSLVERCQNEAITSQMLLGHWHISEPWGVWCRGKSAHIAFTLPRGATALVALYLELALPAFFGERTVKVKVNGRLVDEWTLDGKRAQLKRVVELDETLAIAAPNGEMAFSIEMTLDKIVEPEADATDKRMLGIGIKSMSLADGASPVERLKMLERVLGLSS